MPVDGVLFGVSPYVTAAFGLAGSLIGGFIAGTVSLLVAKEAHEAAEQAWIRDSRRDLYDRFLSNAQKLLIACEAAWGEERGDDAVETAFNDFFEVYAVVQTVAEECVVKEARTHAYRLWELEAALEFDSEPNAPPFEDVARHVRDARQAVIDEMRKDLRLKGSAKPPEDYNPFAKTELEEAWREAGRIRPGGPGRR